MKRASAIACVILLCAGIMRPLQAADETRITEMIKELAQLTALAEVCGEELNNWGNKALESEACKNFSTRFYKAWPDREALLNEVADLFSRIESGSLACDDSCRDRLQRVEELRVTVTYYLDYMDFVKEF